MNKTLNKESTLKDTNSYVYSLVDELKRVHNNTTKSVKIDLTKISIKQAVKLIQQNIDDKKLAIELPNNKLYMLNDNTIDKLSKGLLDENADANATEVFGSDEELKTLTKTISNIDHKVIEPDTSKDPKKRIRSF